jgi:hypothetical protein
MTVSSKRRKKIRVIINSYSQSKLFKTMLTIGFGIATIIMLPLFIVAIPFIFAWDVAGIFMENNIIKEESMDDVKSKWGEFSLDFDSWKKNV